jgi:hypothetical protein
MYHQQFTVALEEFEDSHTKKKAYLKAAQKEAERNERHKSVI